MKRIIFLLLLFPTAVLAQLKVAEVFSSNMVLQRDKPIFIWGKGRPDDIITIEFGGYKKQVKAKADSAWKVEFSKMKASVIPHSIQISSGNEVLQLSNILIGDLWLCIGQSNMEWPMEKEMYYKEEQVNSQQPLLRFYNPQFIGKFFGGVPYTDSMARKLTPAGFYAGKWEVSDTNTVKGMSAVGYYFGKEVLNKTKVPVGLIHLAIGGAPAETFIAKETLRGNAAFTAKLKGNWQENDQLPVWIRKRGKENTESNKNVPEDENGPNHAFKPGFAYESGIAPITGLPIKGILWYQGESNAQEADRVTEYAALLKLMINDYRARWHQPQMPFLGVQLSSIDTMKYKGQLWPEFRDQQRQLFTTIPNGGMAVCSDIGALNDVHPINKKAVGERLARLALNKTYGFSAIVPSGPLPEKAVYKNASVIVSFEYANRLGTSDNQELCGFSVDGQKTVAAFIEGNKVIIPVKEKPDFLYYGWKSYSDGNLVNGDQLPASTFKIEVQ